jgi:hypothetical protein
VVSGLTAVTASEEVGHQPPAGIQVCHWLAGSAGAKAENSIAGWRAESVSVETRRIRPTDVSPSADQRRGQRNSRTGPASIIIISIISLLDYIPAAIYSAFRLIMDLDKPAILFQRTVMAGGAARGGTP